MTNDAQQEPKEGQKQGSKEEIKSSQEPQSEKEEKVDLLSAEPERAWCCRWRCCRATPPVLPATNEVEAPKKEAKEQVTSPEEPAGSESLRQGVGDARRWAPG